MKRNVTIRVVHEVDVDADRVAEYINATAGPDDRVELVDEHLHEDALLVDDIRNVDFDELEERVEQALETIGEPKA